MNMTLVSDNDISGWYGSNTAVMMTAKQIMGQCVPIWAQCAFLNHVFEGDKVSNVKAHRVLELFSCWVCRSTYHPQAY